MGHMGQCIIGTEPRTVTSTLQLGRGKGGVKRALRRSIDEKRLTHTVCWTANEYSTGPFFGRVIFVPTTVFDESA